MFKVLVLTSDNKLWSKEVSEYSTALKWKNTFIKTGFSINTGRDDEEDWLCDGKPVEKGHRFVAYTIYHTVYVMVQEIPNSELDDVLDDVEVS